VNFLQLAHEANEKYTVRDGINIARYALKRLNIDMQNRDISEKRIMGALREAASMILEDKAAEFFAAILEMYGDKKTI
jgi:MoxR-like ATPase